jgi:exodeoxyribonuclease V alpha subunit
MVDMQDPNLIDPSTSSIDFAGKLTELDPSTTTLDYFFAKRFLEKSNLYSEETAQFLSQLMRESRQGHLCWRPENEVPLPPSIVSERDDPFPVTPVIRQNGRYYLQKNWVCETLLLTEVKRLSSTTPSKNYDSALFYQGLQESVIAGKLLPAQAKAIKSAFQNSFSIICGGPGTGKTYTASHLVRLLIASSSKKNLKVILAAPTGKAASHLQSALFAQDATLKNSRVETGTLHRILGMKRDGSSLFSDLKIDADLVIVDEASMIDVVLLTRLVSAIGRETRLVLIGDPDQLPPVEAGSLFAELASLFAVMLEQSMRTNLSHLQQAAAAINRGEEPSLKRSLFDESFPEKLYEFANPIISWEKPDPEECLETFNRFRILGALRQGPFGIDHLNRSLIKELEKRMKIGQWWAIPIMVTTNDPRHDLYNGSCGILIGQNRSGRIDLDEGTSYFKNGDELRSLVPFFPFEIAYCLSIHKSQGSEFEQVLALFPKGSENFGREALYTAVTRAKKEVEIIAEENVLRKVLGQRSRRTSGFTERWLTL